MMSSIWDANTTASFGVAAFAARPSIAASGEAAAKRVKSLRFNMAKSPVPVPNQALIASGKPPDLSVHAASSAAVVVRATQLQARDVGAFSRGSPDGRSPPVSRES
jgi:hypothetical protein